MKIPIFSSILQKWVEVDNKEIFSYSSVGEIIELNEKFDLNLDVDLDYVVVGKNTKEDEIIPLIKCQDSNYLKLFIKYFSQIDEYNIKSENFKSDVIKNSDKPVNKYLPNF